MKSLLGEKFITKRTLRRYIETERENIDFYQKNIEKFEKIHDVKIQSLFEIYKQNESQNIDSFELWVKWCKEVEVSKKIINKLRTFL